MTPQQVPYLLMACAVLGFIILFFRWLVKPDRYQSFGPSYDGGEK